MRKASLTTGNFFSLLGFWLNLSYNPCKIKFWVQVLPLSPCLSWVLLHLWEHEKGSFSNCSLSLSLSLLVALAAHLHYCRNVKKTLTTGNTFSLLLHLYSCGNMKKAALTSGNPFSLSFFTFVFVHLCMWVSEQRIFNNWQHIISLSLFYYTFTPVAMWEKQL